MTATEWILTSFGFLETRDDPRVCFKNPFAQTSDVVDGFIVELQTKRPKRSANLQLRRSIAFTRTGFACNAAACLSTVIAVSKYGSNLGPIASATSPKHARIEIFTFRFNTSLDKFSSSTVTNACAYCSVWSPRARVMSPMMPTATVHNCVSSYALSAG